MSDKKVGEFSPAEHSVKEWAIVQLRGILIVAAVAAVEQARPHVQKWLIEQAVPAAVSTFVSTLNPDPAAWCRAASHPARLSSGRAADRGAGSGRLA
jgi:hypothetical protein